MPGRFAPICWPRDWPKSRSRPTLISRAFPKSAESSITFTVPLRKSISWNRIFSSCGIKGSASAGFPICKRSTCRISGLSREVLTTRLRIITPTTKSKPPLWLGKRPIPISSSTSLSGIPYRGGRYGLPRSRTMSLPMNRKSKSSTSVPCTEMSRLAPRIACG